MRATTPQTCYPRDSAKATTSRSPTPSSRRLAGPLWPAGERNLPHVDDAGARMRGFDGRVMYGGLLNEPTSHLLGVELPGRRVPLHSGHVRYLKTRFPGDQFIVRAKIPKKIDGLRVILPQAEIRRETRQTHVAQGRAQVGVVP